MAQGTRFKRLLKANGLKVPDLRRWFEEHPEHNVCRTALYDLRKRTPKTVDLRMANDILRALEALTGRVYELSDIVDTEYSP